MTPEEEKEHEKRKHHTFLVGLGEQLKKIPIRARIEFLVDLCTNYLKGTEFVYTVSPFNASEELKIEFATKTQFIVEVLSIVAISCGKEQNLDEALAQRDKNILAEVEEIMKKSDDNINAVNNILNPKKDQ